MEGDLIDKDDLVIRRMVDDVRDYDLMVRWRNLPHVRYWWDPDDPPLTREVAIEEYRPMTRPDATSTACIVELQGRPVGHMQFYLWTSYATYANAIGIPFDGDTWGIDLFVGEPERIGRGLGTRMVNLLCEYLEAERNASAVTLTTEVDNSVAIRCYEKAGFKRVVQVRDTDTRNGERVTSWVMTRVAEHEAVGKGPGRSFK